MNPGLHPAQSRSPIRENRRFRIRQSLGTWQSSIALSAEEQNSTARKNGEVGNPNAWRQRKEALPPVGYSRGLSTRRNVRERCLLVGCFGPDLSSTHTWNTCSIQRASIFASGSGLPSATPFGRAVYRSGTAPPGSRENFSRNSPPLYRGVLEGKI